MMTDEEFLEVYRIVTQNTFINGMDAYSYLGYQDVPKELEMIPQLHAIVEKKFDDTLVQGAKEFRIDVNENETSIIRTLNIIEESFRNNSLIHNREFCIDSRFLKYQEVIDFLNRSRENGYIMYLRIIGEDYVLDEDTYNQLAEFQLIEVNDSNIQRQNIELRGGPYNYSVGINEQLNTEVDGFIKEDMSDEELLELINYINGLDDVSCKKINIRFYNPVVAVEMIERLDRLGLDNNVDIRILGYPLVESSETYNRLEEISNKRNIEVSYTCCHDYLGDFCQEPYLIDNSYYSELEPHGKTDFKTYLKILKFVENFQESVANVDSNIEKTMMAYQFLNENYYYALNAGENRAYGATRDIDKILDTDEIVCVGYANLLTLMCRRIGIPMFTYAAPQHVMNVARIVEKDENGEVILDKICTFDPTNDCGRYVEDLTQPSGQVREEQRDSYTFFGLDPETWLHDSETSFITLANALALPKEELDRYGYFSRSPYSSGYVGGYTPRSYMYSMLHLMGYSFDPENVNMDDLVAQLQEEGRIGEIPKELIYRAASNLEERKNNRELTDEQLVRISDSFDRRNRIFSSTNARINLNNVGNQIAYVETYKTNMPEHNFVDINAIDVGPQYFEEIERLRTGTPRRTTQSTTAEIVQPQPENPRNEVVPPVNQPTQKEPVEVQEPTKFTEEDFSEGYIAGTTIRRPRERGIYETDEEYVEFLRNFYNYYFPDAVNNSTEIYQPTAERIFTEEDFSDGYILGTDVRRPRARGTYETDEEYVEFLREYYEYFFPNTKPITVHMYNDYVFKEDDFQDELIPGTDIRKPRMRGIYETDEEYEAFLQRYSEHFFPNIEKQPVTTNQEDNSSERNSSLYENNKNQYLDYKEKKNQINDMLNNFDNSQIDYYNEDDDINHIAR